MPKTVIMQLGQAKNRTSGASLTVPVLSVRTLEYGSRKRLKSASYSYSESAMS